MFKRAYQRSCCQHLWIDFFKKFGDEGLRKLFLKAVKAGTEETFQRALSKIKEKNKPAYDYLAILNPKSWSFYTIELSCKVEHVTSNFVESFNKWLDELRYMPPMKLLDELRGNLAETIW